MKIVTKRIRCVEMTQEEVKKFHELMERASTGHTSHYAEERLEDGSYLGVSVVPTPATDPIDYYDKKFEPTAPVRAR